MGNDLERLIPIVSALIDGLPDVVVGGGYDTYSQSHLARRRAAVAALRELEHREGARWRQHGDRTSLTLAGIRSESTGGEAAAMKNWIAAADKKRAGGVA